MTGALFISIGLRFGPEGRLFGVRLICFAFLTRPLPIVPPLFNALLAASAAAVFFLWFYPEIPLGLGNLSALRFS